MKFEKKNHHYVPQFWLRGFRETNDAPLYGKVGSDIKVVSTKKIMQDDWLYTLFDSQWNPSDKLEDALAKVEAEDAKLFKRLHTSGYSTTPDDHDHLCAVLALQLCRHPDILKRGHKLSKEFGSVLANVHSMTLDEFKSNVAVFGIDEKEAYINYVYLRARPREQLAQELDALMVLSPQSSQLPSQDALRAVPQLVEILKSLELWLLDALPSDAFVLGDTPLPQSNLGLGFSVPLSKSLAVYGIPSTTVQNVLNRRIANATEVRAINRIQSDNALEVVIGHSVSLLKSL